MPEQDLEPIFEEYARLTARADELFARVSGQYAAEVTCAPGCGDCCHALFDLPLVEAMALNRAFQAEFGFGAQRSAVLGAAAEADRAAARLKRDYYRQARQGATDEELLSRAAQDRIRCPLLGADDTCLLYARRPVTCRLYGVPTLIHGQTHVCPKCAFKAGAAYPTVALDRIQDSLAGLSRELVKALGSRFQELHTVYVPVSMALLTKYDDAYLGVGDSS